MSIGSLAMKRAGSLLESETLSASLTKAGLRNAASPPLVVERGWPLAKIPLLVRCSGSDTQISRRRWWSFYFLGSDEVPFSCRAALKDGTAVYLEDLHAVVQAFPDDLLLSNVERAASKKPALRALKSALPERGRDWQSLTTRVLTYKPSRRLTVRYRLTPAAGRGRTIFAKLYPTNGDQQPRDVQQTLVETPAERGSEQFSVAQIIGDIPSWNALLWRRMSGHSLFELLDSSDLGDAVGRVARCLAALHGSRVQWTRIHDRERELRTVQSWVRAIGLAEPACRTGVGSTYQRLCETATSTAAAPLVPSHRDFYDKQVLLDERQCTLLDLEVASRAEPELDVANFLAHLELRALQRRIKEVEPTTQVFLAEYSRAGLRLDASRLSWYLASSLLRLACVYSLRPEWDDLTSSLMQASTKAVDGARYLLRESL